MAAVDENAAKVVRQGWVKKKGKKNLKIKIETQLVFFLLTKY